MRQLSPQKPCIICRFQFREVICKRAYRALHIAGSVPQHPCARRPCYWDTVVGPPKAFIGLNQVNFPPHSSSPYCPSLTGTALEEEESYFLWNASAWLGTPDMIRCITAFTTSTHTGSGLCIQSEQQICWRDPCLTTKSAAAPTRNTNQKTSP